MPIDQTRADASVEQAASEGPNHPGVPLIAKLILLGVLVFAAGEASWRMVGVRPSYSDLLAFARLRRAAQNSANAVALIGSSRVHCDLDPGVLKRGLPGNNIYQLGIEGSSALPMLQDLAQDAAFRGHVLCEFSMMHFTAGSPSGTSESGEQRYIRFFRRQPYIDFLGTWIYESVSQHFALLEEKDREFPTSLISTIKTRLAFAGSNRVDSSSTPEDAAVLQEPQREEDRFAGLHLRGKDNAPLIVRWTRMTRHRGNGDPEDAERQVVSWVKMIRQRGGDVDFVRMPVSGSLKRIEDEVYPDRDRIIQLLTASNIVVIDSAKVPTLDQFECPDESHLDFDEAEKFSAALAWILKNRQLLTRNALDVR